MLFEMSILVMPHRIEVAMPQLNNDISKYINQSAKNG